MSIVRVKQIAHNVLRKTEKYTKTDMVYLARGGFWLSAAQVVATCASILLAIAFANFLPKENYGTYKYILSLADILLAITLTGMNTAVTQAVARGFEGMLKKTFWYQIKWNLIFFASAFAMGIYYLINGNNSLAISLFVVGIFYPILNSANTYAAFLNGKKEFRYISKYGMVTSIVTFLSVFSTMLLTHDPVFLVSSFIISTTAANLFFYFKTFEIFNPNSKEDSGTIRYGKHLSLMNVLTVVADKIDSVLLFHFLGPTQLALYSFAVAPAEQIKGLFKNIVPLSMPKFVNKDIGEIKRGMWHKMFILFLTLSGIVLIYVIAAPTLFRLIFPKYMDAVSLSQLYSLSLIVYLGQPIQAALQAHQKVKLLYITSNVSSFIQIVFLTIGIYFWGLIGAVVALILYRVASLLFGTILFIRMKN